MLDRSSDALRTLGFLDEAEAALFDERRARAPSETWSDTLRSIGVDEATLRGALMALETRPATSGLSQIDVTPETDGRYDKVAELGIGGMGRVELIDDRHLHRAVARKELLLRHPATEVRFLREARITAQLEHPGVVPVYELGKNADGTLYYTMKRIRGKTLREALADCESLEERLALLGAFVDLCNAVGYAHAKGVVHRDLKPDNVMIGPFGETLVLDWGLAKIAGEEELPLETAAATQILIRSGDDSNLTRAGTVLGTPRYMSPEQASGRLNEVDARSDVWSLGAMLYEILAGIPAFTGETAVVLDQVRRGEVPPVQDTEPGAPAELTAIAQKCLAKDPEHRYETAVGVAAEIEAWRNGTVVAAHDYTALERLHRAATQYRVALVGVGAMLLALLVSAGLFIPGLIRQRDLAEQGQTEATLQAQRSLFRATLYEALEREQDGDSGAALALLRLAASLPGLSTAESHTAEMALTRLVDRGADLLVLSNEPVAATAQAWLPNGSLIAWSTADEVRFSDPQNGTLRGTLPSPGGAITALAFQADGGSILIGTDDGHLAAFVFPTGAKRTEWTVTGPIKALRISPDGKRVAVENEGVTVLSLEDGSEVFARPDARGGHWTDQGRHLVVTRESDVEIFETVGWSLRGVLAHPAAGLSLAIAQVPDSVATARLLDSSLVRRIVNVQDALDTADLGWTHEGPPPPRGPTRLAYLALRDMLRLTLKDDDESNAHILTDLGRAALEQVERHARDAAEAEPSQAAEMLWVSAEAHFHFASLGLEVAAPSTLQADGEVWAYRDLLRERVRPQFMPLLRRATRLTVEALEAALVQGIREPWVLRARSRLELAHPRAVAVTGAQDDRVRVWALGPGLLRNAFVAHEGDVHDVAITGDLSRVASGGPSGEVRVWDLNLGDPVLTISTGDPEPTSVLFLPGDERLLSRAKRSGTAHVWETVSARSTENIRENQVTMPTKSLRAGSGRITSTLSDPHGNWLAVATRRGGTRLWPLSDPLRGSRNVGLEPTLVGLGDQVVVDAERLQVHDAETLRPLLDIGAEMQPERGTARLTQAVSRDDLAVLAFDDGRLGLLRKDQGWDWLIPGPSKPHITHLALSPAPGTGILATTADQKGLIFSEDGQTTLNFEVAPAAAWTETGDQWAWALADGGVAVRSLVRDESGRDVAQGLDVSHLHWLDRKRLLMASDTRLVEWDVETDTPVRVWVERNTPILNLWARPLEVSLSTTEDLLTLDVATGQRLATIPLRGSAAGTFVHWTDRGLLVTEDGVPGLRILDPRGGDIARELAFSSRATSALQMPDQLLVGTTDGILHRLGGPPAIQTNLRACRNGRVVAILPFPPLDRLMEPDACGMNTAPP